MELVFWKGESGRAFKISASDSLQAVSVSVSALLDEFGCVRELSGLRQGGYPSWITVVLVEEKGRMGGGEESQPVWKRE